MRIMIPTNETLSTAKSTGLSLSFSIIKESIAVKTGARLRESVTNTRGRYFTAIVIKGNWNKLKNT